MTKIWYTTPADVFEEALPLGNGRIGAMIFGGIAHDHVVLNEDTLWTGAPCDQTVPGAQQAVEDVRDALRTGDLSGAESFAKGIQGKFTESYLPAGNLRLSFCHKEPVCDYRRELDIERGITTVRYRSADTEFTRTTFVSFPDQMIVLRFEASKPEAITLTAHFDSLLMGVQRHDETDLTFSGTAPALTDSVYHSRASVQQLDSSGKTGMRFQMRLRAKVSGGVHAMKDAGVYINNANMVELRISISTSFNGAARNPITDGIDEVAHTRATLDHAELTDFIALRDRHESDFLELSRRCRLELGDEVDNQKDTLSCINDFAESHDPSLAALYFNYGRYLLIACSRPGSMAANLQGIWNEQLQPPWSSNYTTNINAEMNYWLAENCNLSDCHEPLFDLIDSIRSVGGKIAAKNYNCRGWCCHHNSDLWGTAVAVGGFGREDPRWSCWPMGGAWLCAHLMEHYRFTHDSIFLSERAWPAMKGAALFLLDWLVEWTIDGETWLVTAPSTSPENGYTVDGHIHTVSIATTMDMTLIRELFLNVTEAARVLSIEDSILDEIDAAMPRLYPYQIGAQGQLQEYYQDYNEPEPQHRHLSHLYCMYPADLVQPDRNPELTAAVQRSMELRGDNATGWSFGWKTCLWARLQNGNRAWKIIQLALRLAGGRSTGQISGGGVYPNLFDAHPPFQIDGNFGVTAGIAEMLMQSHQGLIHLLPALPEDWTKGKVTGLCTRSGAVVDLEWNNGSLTNCTIQMKKPGRIQVKYRSETQSIEFGESKYKSICFTT